MGLLFNFLLPEIIFGSVAAAQENALQVSGILKTPAD